MKKTLLLLLDAYFYGAMFATMFTFIHIIGVAATQDWIITLNFNIFGEGAIEYALCLLWLVVAVIKLVIEVNYWLNTEEKVAL